MGGGAAGHDGGGGVDSDQMQIVGAENVETGSQLRDSGKLPITSPKLKEKGYEDSVLIAKNCGILLGKQVAGCLAERIGESNSVMGCSNNLGQQQALSQAQGAFIQNSGVGLFSPTTTSLPAKLQQKDGSSLVNENLQPAWDSAKDKLPTTVLEPREGKFSFVFGAGTSGGKKGTRRWKKAARVASTNPLTASEAVVQPHVGKNRCLEPQDEELNDGTEPVAAKKSKKQGEESVASGEASIT
ncbi:type II secretion system protein E [Corchorus olitorius]|uniref:Type II secretion system protein E n=1 Tax=Corchorus olitorius TaxID=93759 RepID=A0A1R3H5Q1_9ROSI|nr:type II secretion system protein E [Corchorus olitorius]